MNQLNKRTGAVKLTGIVCPVLLTSISAALLVIGQLWSWRGLWLLGLVGLLPGMIQLFLLLPVPKPRQPEEEAGKIKLFFHRLRLRYIKFRSGLITFCILLTGIGCLLLWRIQPSGEAQLGYHIPIIAAVVFVLCAAMEKLCEHLSGDTPAGYRLKGLASGFFMLRMACIGVILAALLKLIGWFDGDAILQVVLTLVLCYEAISLVFSLAV